MKTALAALILVSFAGMATFAVFAWGMHDESHEGFKKCLAMAVGSGACPEESNIVAYAVFHLAAFKKFSTAVVTMLTALFLLVGIAAFIKSIAGRIRTSQIAPVLRSQVSPREIHPTEIQELLSWLEFHENSPTTP